MSDESSSEPEGSSQKVEDNNSPGPEDNNSHKSDENNFESDEDSPEPDSVPDKICALFRQLNLEHIINGIKEVVLGDIEHLVDMANGRELDASTIILLFDEAMNTRTGQATIIALTAAALVVCIVMIVFPLPTAAPFFTEAGPAAGSIAAACQSTFGVNAVFSTLQSAAMGGYGAPIVAGCVQGAAAAGATVAGFNLFEAFDGLKN